MFRIAVAAGILCVGALASPSPSAVFDEAFLNRGTESQARLALRGYRQLSTQDPLQSEWWWKRAMASQFVGFRLEKEPESRLALFQEGQDAGKRAVQLAPECAPCLFWRAINMALYGAEKGIVSMLFTLGPIQDDLEKSAKLNPSYAHAGAFRVLGIIYQKVPGLLGGSNRQARRYFQRAIREVPSNPLNYLMLARHWLDEMEEPARALEITQAAVRLPIPSSKDVESFEAFLELKEMHSRLRNQLAMEKAT